MKIQKLQIYIQILCLLCAIAFVSACDTENLLNIDGEMLEIDLQSESQTLNIGDTTTITATVNYSGNPAVLVYEWNASGGRIIGNGESVVYVAPESAGTYTITLEVSDGTVTERNDIRIEVNIGHAIVAMPNRYWQGNTFTQTLTYRLNVEEIFRDNITLRYEILQDTARAGAFLTITINGTPVIRNNAIGAVQPAEMLLVADGVDVSRIITAPGNYELALTLEVVNVMEDAWLLRKLTLIGVEGTITELR
ncbi:MAG: hypothetical protein OXU23_24720 [Candidatus Poribacteria bacterium]|nr:hypothetical protein [Candidatus Poribacteria bacterium]